MIFPAFGFRLRRSLPGGKIGERVLAPEVAAAGEHVREELRRDAQAARKLGGPLLPIIEPRAQRVLLHALRFCRISPPKSSPFAYVSAGAGLLWRRASTVSP